MESALQVGASRLLWSHADFYSELGATGSLSAWQLSLGLCRNEKEVGARRPGAVGTLVQLPFMGLLLAAQREAGGRRRAVRRKNKSRDFLRLLVPGGKTLNVW